MATAAPGIDLLSLLPGLKRPLIMGVVNVTPDSFYPNSRTPDSAQAVARGLALVSEGADILDIGGQSTRPGSEPVSLDDELRRVLPVVEALAKKTSVPISIDTDKAEVARRARAAGASLLNDVSALRADAGMPAVAVAFDAVVLMHRGGSSPKTMQAEAGYDDVVAEVFRFFQERRDAFVNAGGDAGRLVYDPGIGFGKDHEQGHNLSLLKRAGEFTKLGPVLIGASRKSFLGQITPDAGPQDRLEGSLAAACWAAFTGASIIRVHDVAATKRALDVVAAIKAAR